MNTSSEMTVCKCNHCDGQLQFDRSNAGATTPCPHCGLDTILFIPHTAESRALQESEPEDPDVLPERSIALPDGDQCFLRERGIAVTKTRFMVANQLFALANISSVRLEKIDPSQTVAGVVFTFAAIVAIMGVVNEAPEGIVVGVIIGIVGFAMLVSRKTTYRVILFASGGEITGYESRDQKFLVRVVEALNQAIIARG